MTADAPIRPEWAEGLEDRLRSDHMLGPLTTLKVGGPAEWYYPAETSQELTSVLTRARAAGVKVTLLGDGSNMLISDLGIRGLVVHNRAKRIRRDGDDLVSESGTLLAALVDRARDESLTGLEFASGIYGSVGGAVYGNAGAYGKSMADVLVWADVLTSEGERLRLPPDDLGFEYRKSACARNRWVVLECRVSLQPGEFQAIDDEVKRIIAIRSTKLPTNLPSAGSYFKNIEDSSAEYGKIPAGKLLEEVGAKSFRVGGAGVYEKHANVIVNLGGASAADVLALAEKMRLAVLERFGIDLQNEVRFIGEPMPYAHVES